MSAICCPFCPFAGCIWCEHKGGTEGAETPATQADRANEAPEKRARNGKVGGSKTAPEDAPTSTPGPRPTEAAKPHGRTCIT